eukprot:7380833-Prymnesium_polylepis.1
MVRQVVLNLLSNAMRLTQSGVVRLRCAERGGAGGGGGGDADSRRVRVVIEVADTGPGLPPERCAQLTQRYGLSVGGVGLGLHVVGRLLECLGSELHAMSPVSDVTKSASDGPGVSLWFELALDRAPPAAVKTAVDAQAAALPALPAELRVLVADDVTLNRRVLRMALRKVCPQWVVEEAATAVAAAAALVAAEEETE